MRRRGAIPRCALAAAVLAGTAFLVLLDTPLGAVTTNDTSTIQSAVTPGSPDQLYPLPDAPLITPPAAAIVPPVAVKGVVVIRGSSNVLRHAFVAGESFRLAGDIPADCVGPTLHLDGHTLGPVDTRTGGAFELGIVTRYLAAGRHVAEIFCTDPVARLSRTVFWVAAPQTSSNLFFVILVSLFMVGAIGWVALGTFASAALGKAPARP